MNKLLKSVAIILVVVAVVYFGNKGVQTYLGKQAVGVLAFQVYNLDKAKAIATQEGKLILADYSAIWCPTCRKLDTQVFANDDVAIRIDDSFVYARLDYDSEEGKAFAQKHDLVGFPRVLILDTKGKRLTEMPLTFEPSEYILNLDKVTQTFAANMP